MQMKHSIYGILKTYLALLLFMAIAQGVQAQGVQQVEVRTRVLSGVNFSNVQTTQVDFCTFRSEAKASRARDILEKAYDAQSGKTDAEIKQIETELGIAWRRSTANGIFKLNVLAGQGVVIRFGDAFTSFGIQPGTNLYPIDIKGRVELAGTKVIGKMSESPWKIGGGVSLATDKEVIFPINVSLRRSMFSDNNRLIVQPIVVDCQTEDTVARLRPFIFESAEYHKLQDRRMNFDYHKKDDVSPWYTDTLVLSDTTDFNLNTKVVFVKPFPKRSYKCNYPVVLEDYHHVLFREGNQSGSCKQVQLFKFLDLATAASDLPLTSEFQEEADATPQEYNQDIDLRFRQGSDELLSDSINQKQMEILVRDLKSYGDLLAQVQFQAGTSPEGSEAINRKIAKDRANKALSLLRGRLPADVPRIPMEPKVSTWADLLADVESQGIQENTDMVRTAIETHKQNEVYGVLKSLPIYESVIEPIMTKQRMMRCKYYVFKEHVMEPEEARQAYYTYKADYLSGKKHLSEGDYFNLFATVHDSVEIDTVTMLAYNYIAKQPQYYRLKLAPYAANKMAMLKIRKGTPDLEILRPFLDFKYNVNARKPLDEYSTITVNRVPMMLNQAIMYSMLSEQDSALMIIDNMPLTPETKNMKMVTLFTRDYANYLAGKFASDPVATANIQEAERYVLNSSADNKAIMAAELYKYKDSDPKFADVLVDKMSDDNPKKWYLKGMLYSDKGMLADDDGLSFDTSSDMDDDGIDITGIPRYLAYFQHCFDLKPEYKFYYFNEANVDEKTREKYKYKKAQIPAYRKLFRLLKAQADKEKALDNNDISDDETATAGTTSASADSANADQSEAAVQSEAAGTNDTNE